MGTHRAYKIGVGAAILSTLNRIAISESRANFRQEPNILPAWLWRIGGPTQALGELGNSMQIGPWPGLKLRFQVLQTNVYGVLTDSASSLRTHMGKVKKAWFNFSCLTLVRWEISIPSQVSFEGLNLNIHLIKPIMFNYLFTNTVSK